MKRFLIFSLSAALTFHPTFAGVAAAQEVAEPLTPAPGENADAAAESTPPSSAPSTRETAPNTDSCPNAQRPPKPVTTSENVAPGQPSPTYLPPVADSPCGVTAPDGFDVPKEVLASAWLVADADTGEIIAEKDPNGRYRPASIIKVLLALVVIDELPLDKKITVSAESASIDGSAVGIGPGGVYTVEQLLQGLVMASGNDAAHALAQVLGGDEVTLEKVNALAVSLGTSSTYAASYSGLDAPGMSTSARDMGLIYAHAYQNATFSKLIGTEKVKFPGYGEVPGYELWNDNGLFMNDPHGIGGKTGYTDDAHHTFVGALNRDGRRLFAVVLDTTVDHGPRAWQQAQELLHEAYTVPAGGGVGTLRPTGAAESSAAAWKTPEADPKAATNANKPQTSQPVKPWLPWLVVGLVGFSVLVTAVFSLLRRPRDHRV